METAEAKETRRGVRLSEEHKGLVRAKIQEFTSAGVGRHDLPRTFLEAARDPANELHTLFGERFWDDRYMADLKRCDRIREVINTVTISDTDERPCVVAVPLAETLEELSGADGDAARYSWQWKPTDNLDEDDMAAISRKELLRVRAAIENVEALGLQDRFPGWRALASIVAAWSDHAV